MTHKPLDDSWKAWLEENLERRCDPNELVWTLLHQGFSVRSIREHMGDRLPADFPDHRAISETRLTQASIDPRPRRVATDKLQLYVLDDFMSPSECDGMVAIIGKHLRPSTITMEDEDAYYRTSSTCDLSLLNEPLVSEIDERIARTLGIRLAYSEGIQAQRYDVGQEFKSHTDYFEPGMFEYAEHATTQGNRTWTFMVYLNEGMQGGDTTFVSIDESFPPKKGQAVCWNSLYPDGEPNPDTLHWGTPVTSGHKIIITKWFRERGAGPMFYESTEPGRPVADD